MQIEDTFKRSGDLSADCELVLIHLEDFIKD